jgi:SAM-dependent methyltransferase
MHTAATPLAGPDFYDDRSTFNEYMQVRDVPDDANMRLEQPSVQEFVGKPEGLAVLDLGCGDGRYAVELLEAGARAYLGVDGSSLMLDAARQRLAGQARAELVRANLEDWVPDGLEFDLVVARMSFHYVEDLLGLLRRVRSCLRPGGRLVASVEHPVITSNYDQADPAPGASSWAVSGYFREGARRCSWLGSEVVKQHRTTASYVSLLGRAGFTLEGLSEGAPRQDDFEFPQNFERAVDVPFYLIFCGKAV